MSGSLGGKNATPLYAEHLMLGAKFGEDGRVRNYGNTSPSGIEQYEGCFLADITHVSTLALFGPVAKSFAEATFAGSKLGVGTCRYEAVLTGDGSVASVPLLVRTGVGEYVAFDFSPRRSVLSAWLEFVRSASQDGYAPYESLDIQDATGTHCVLAVWGNKASDILTDYTAKELLPKPGHVAACHLDKIPCIVLNLGLPGTTLYLVLVPPASSVVLWRSLLSFTEVTPVGASTFDEVLGEAHPWQKRLCEVDVVRMSGQELKRFGLIRSQEDYIGARGLSPKNDGEA